MQAAGGLLPAPGLRSKFSRKLQRQAARQAGSASAGRPSVCIFYIAQTPFPPSLWHISCDSLTWTRQHEFVGQIVSVQWSKFVWGGCIAGEGAWENWGVINDRSRRQCGQGVGKVDKVGRCGQGSKVWERWEGVGKVDKEQEARWARWQGAGKVDKNQAAGGKVGFVRTRLPAACISWPSSDTHNTVFKMLQNGQNLLTQQIHMNYDLCHMVFKVSFSEEAAWLYSRGKYFNEKISTKYFHEKISRGALVVITCLYFHAAQPRQQKYISVEIHPANWSVYFWHPCLLSDVWIISSDASPISSLVGYLNHILWCITDFIITKFLEPDEGSLHLTHRQIHLIGFF